MSLRLRHQARAVHDDHGPAQSCTVCGRRHRLEAEASCLHCRDRAECPWCPLKLLAFGVYAIPEREVTTGWRL